MDNLVSQHSQEIIERHYLNAAITTEEMALVTVLKPRIFLDGNAWCILWGENLQDGVCGFGDTPMDAVYDFNKAWHVKPKAKIEDTDHG